MPNPIIEAGAFWGTNDADMATTLPDSGAPCEDGNFMSPS